MVKKNLKRLHIQFYMSPSNPVENKLYQALKNVDLNQQVAKDFFVKIMARELKIDFSGDLDIGRINSIIYGAKYQDQPLSSSTPKNIVKDPSVKKDSGKANVKEEKGGIELDGVQL